MLLRLIHRGMSTDHRPNIEILRLHPQRDEDLPLPRYMTAGAAGCDVVAANTEPIVLQSLQREAVPTGLAMAIPAGYEVQVRPRSGQALRRGLTVLNAPGTIDSDYRGEVKILLVNLDAEPQQINRGERIAQLIVAPVARAAWRPVAALSATSRGVGGFGSTDRQ